MSDTVSIILAVFLGLVCLVLALGAAGFDWLKISARDKARSVQIEGQKKQFQEKSKEAQ